MLSFFDVSFNLIASRLPVDKAGSSCIATHYYSRTFLKVCNISIFCSVNS